MSANDRILDRERSVLLVIDLQDAYRGKFWQESRVIAATRTLLQASSILEIPVIVTEQYPKGLGATRSDIDELLPDNAQRFVKTSFSCLGAEGLTEQLQALGRNQVVITGIETHVCVNQTVHDLLEMGLQTHLVRNAISARFELDDAQGYAKMLESGAIAGSAESVLFEWLRDAKSPDFKAVHRLITQTDLG